jgi:hypothetical protein
MSAPGPAVATIVARNYLAFARVLGASLRTQHPRLPFVVVVMDAEDDEPLALPDGCERLPIRAFGIPELRHACFRRSCQELAVLFKPFLLQHLLDRGLSPAVFIDPDVLVEGDLTPVLDVVRRHAVTLTPHLLGPLEGDRRIERELNILQSGTFNAGFVGVSEGPTARRALDWWRNRLLANCSAAVADGAYYDQRWLDLLPMWFEDVKVLRDPGCNVAYWNVQERGLRASPQGLLAGGSPLRFFHFSGFDPEEPASPSRHAARHWAGTELPEIYARYATLLLTAGYRSTHRIPYRFASFDNGELISARAREIHEGLGRAAADFGDPFVAAGQSFYAWLMDRHPDVLSSASATARPA